MSLVLLSILMIGVTLFSMWFTIWVANVFMFLLSLAEFFTELLLSELLAPWASFLLTAIVTVPVFTIVIMYVLMQVVKLEGSARGGMEPVSYVILFACAFIVLISCDTRVAECMPGFIQNIACFFHDKCHLKLWNPIGDMNTHMTMFDISLGISVLGSIIYGNS